MRQRTEWWQTGGGTCAHPPTHPPTGRLQRLHRQPALFSSNLFRLALQAGCGETSRFDTRAHAWKPASPQPVAAAASAAACARQGNSQGGPRTPPAALAARFSRAARRTAAGGRSPECAQPLPASSCCLAGRQRRRLNWEGREGGRRGAGGGGRWRRRRGLRARHRVPRCTRRIMMALRTRGEVDGGRRAAGLRAGRHRCGASSTSAVGGLQGVCCEP